MRAAVFRDAGILDGAPPLSQGERSLACGKRNDDALEPLQSLQDAGFLLHATANEPGLSRGTISRRDLDQQLMALLALGEAYGLLEQSTEARNYYTEGLRLAEVEHRVPAEARLRLRLAQIESAGGQLNESIASGKRALLLSQTLRDPVTEAAAWSLLAVLFRKMEREPEAKEAEQRAVAIYRSQEIFVLGAR